jgi:hypothetical protein
VPEGLDPDHRTIKRFQREPEHRAVGDRRWRVPGRSLRGRGDEI